MNGKTSAEKAVKLIGNWLHRDDIEGMARDWNAPEGFEEKFGIAQELLSSGEYDKLFNVAEELFGALELHTSEDWVEIAELINEYREIPEA